MIGYYIAWTKSKEISAICFLFVIIECVDGYVYIVSDHDGSEVSDLKM